MAIQFEGIFLPIDAPTQGLRKAVADINAFSRSVDDAISRQEEGINRLTQVYAKQERAMREAFVQTRNMYSELKNFSVGESRQNLLGANTKALREYIKEMSSGALNTVEFNRAQDKFRVTMNRLKHEMGQLDMPEGGGGGFIKMLRDLESASVLAVGPLSGLGARIRALGSITSRSTLGMAAMLGAITGVTVGMGMLSAGSVQAAREIEKIDASFKVATGSSITAAREFEYVTDTSQQLGLNLLATAQGYAQLAAASRGTALEGEGVRKIFQGIASASAALRMSGEQTSGALRAVTQMVSKGTVQAEELRGQLAERIPGALKIAADAMGVTELKLNTMMESGELLASDLLPRLGAALQDRFGDAAVQAGNSIEGSINRLSNSMLLFNKAFDEAVGISDVYRGSLQLLTATLDGARNNLDVLLGSAGAATGVLLALTGPAILRGAVALGAAIKGMALSMLGLQAAAAGAAAPIIGMTAVVGRLITVLGSAAAGYYLFANSIPTAREKQLELSKDIEDFVLQLEASKRSSRQTIELNVAAAQSLMGTITEQVRTLRSQIEKVAKVQETLQDTSWTSPENMQLSEDASEKLAKLRQQLKDLTADYAKQADLVTRMNKILLDHSDEVVNASKAYETARGKVQELAQEVLVLQDAMTLKGAGADSDTVQQMLDLGEAIKKLKGITPADADKLLAELRAQGLAADDLYEAVARLIKIKRDDEKAIKDWLTVLEKTPKTVADINFEIEQLAQKLVALKMGKDAFEAFQREDKVAQQLKKTEDALNNTSLAAEERAEILSTLGRLLRETILAEEEYNLTLKQRQNADKLEQDIGDLAREYNAYTTALKLAGEAGREAGLAVLDYADAVKAIGALPVEQQEQLRLKLKALGIEGISLSDALARLLGKTNEAQDAWNRFVRNLEEAPKAIRETENEIANLTSEIAALRRGPDALKAFERMRDNREAVEQLRDSLEKAGVEQAKINQLTEEYGKKLELRDKAQDHFDRVMKSVKLMEDAIDDIFKDVSQSIAEQMVYADKSITDLGETARKVLANILAGIQQAMIYEPLAEGLKQAGRSMMFKWFGMEKGGVFSRGRVTKAEHGTVLTRPTIIPAANGMVMAREAGEDEAVMPLVRTAGGDLGVRAAGAGGRTQINIYNNTGGDAKVSQRTTSQGEQIDVIIDKVVAGKIRSGGHTRAALQEQFGLSTRVQKY
jgi:tape measure domain-containing protein